MLEKNTYYELCLYVFRIDPCSMSFCCFVVLSLTLIFLGTKHCLKVSRLETYRQFPMGKVKCHKIIIDSLIINWYQCYQYIFLKIWWDWMWISMSVCKYTWLVFSPIPPTMSGTGGIFMSCLLDCLFVFVPKKSLSLH